MKQDTSHNLNTSNREPFTESAKVNRAIGIIGTVILLVGLFLLRTDFEIIAYGTVSRDEEFAVYAPADGRVEAIYLREGDRVDLAEAVLVLDYSDLELKILAKRRELAGMEFRLSMTNLALRELELKPASVEMMVSRDKSRLLEQIAGIQKDLIGRLEELERNRDIKTIELLSGRIEQLRVELEGLEARVRADWLDAGVLDLDKEKLLLEKQQLERDIELVRGEIRLLEREQGQRIVRSPTTGYLTKLAIRYPGLVVQRGDELFRVSDPTSPYIVEVLVPERNVDLILPGASVRMESEVFDSTFDGYIHGVVRRVSPDALSRHGGGEPIQGSSQFLVEVEVEETPLPLVLGSRLKAYILLGKRPIWRVFINPRGAVERSSPEKGTES